MNSFGRIFRVSIFGESHGDSVGVLIDGCPPGINIKPNDFKKDLLRRKPGALGTTTRLENDKPIIESGIFDGKSTGAPILIRFENKNVESKDYKKFKDIPRPGHADFTSGVKYAGFNDYRGSGHFSGRLTVGLVAAGVIAKKIINPINVSANILSVGGSKDIKKSVAKVTKEGDSIGGIIECVSLNIPVGLGEPFFDSLESVISHLIFSIPAIKGIEFGAGFKVAEIKGSEINDRIIDGKGTTKTNNSGGINGGISNGNPIIFRVAVKPPSSISKPQITFNFKKGNIDILEVKGRHDSCIALRIPVIIEAVTAIALTDFKLLDKNKLAS
jgi:chorismate synthase